MGLCQNKGCHLQGSHNKDDSISGSISGSPYLGKLRCIPCTDPEKPQGSRSKGKLQDADQGPLTPNTVVSINKVTPN